MLRAVCINKQMKEGPIALDEILFVYKKLMLSTWLVTSGGCCNGGQHAWPTMALSGMRDLWPESGFNWEEQGSRGGGCPSLLPPPPPEPSLQSCSSSLAPAPQSRGLTPQWCRVLCVLLSTSGKFLRLVVTLRKGRPPLPQYQRPSCPL